MIASLLAALLNVFPLAASVNSSWLSRTPDLRELVLTLVDLGELVLASPIALGLGDEVIDGSRKSMIVENRKDQ